MGTLDKNLDFDIKWDDRKKFTLSNTVMGYV